jgi:ketosteroid isomerase-like protein
MSRARSNWSAVRCAPVANSNTDLLERFYAAFAARDGEGMAACYSDDVSFADPVFPGLRGSEAGGMWKFLTGGSGALRVELLEHGADDSRGSAHWVAYYTFTRTGRPVVNDVRAQFCFAGGLIVDHHDDFNFHRWASQALGPAGMVLGWTPMLRAAVRRQAREGLDRFLATSG